MKKLSILLSMLMIVGMFGTVASAAGTTDATIVLSPDKTTVAVGEEITITVGLNGDSEGKGLNGTAKVVPQWDMEYLEYVDGSGEVDSTTFALTNATTVATNYVTTKGQLTFAQKIVTDDGVVSGDQTYGTFKLKAIKATDTTTAITLNSSTSVVYLPEGGTANDRASVAEDTTVAVTIKAASTKTEITADTTATAGHTDVANNTAFAYYVKLGADYSGKTGYWTAQFDGTAYKHNQTFKVPTITGEGTANYGLIYKGDKTISEVKFVLE